MTRQTISYIIIIIGLILLTLPSSTALQPVQDNPTYIILQNGLNSYTLSLNASNTTNPATIIIEIPRGLYLSHISILYDSDALTSPSFQIKLFKYEGLEIPLEFRNLVSNAYLVITIDIKSSNPNWWVRLTINTEGNSENLITTSLAIGLFAGAFIPLFIDRKIWYAVIYIPIAIFLSYLMAYEILGVVMSLIAVYSVLN